MNTSPLHRADSSLPCFPGVEVIAITSARVFPRHAHDQLGIGLMAHGAHASWSGRGSVVAEQGDVIAVNPNEVHDGTPIGKVRSWDMIFIEPSSLATLVGQHLAAREIEFAAGRKPALAPLVTRAFYALREGDAAVAEEAMTELMGKLLGRSSTRLGYRDAGRSRGVEMVIELIHDAPDSLLSLDEVARLMGLSRTAALRRFRQETGTTPQDYAMQWRLRLARRALHKGEPIAEVAAAAGFADQSHLTRAFTRQFGLPPGRWRDMAVARNIVQDQRPERR